MQNTLLDAKAHRFPHLRKLGPASRLSKWDHGSLRGGDRNLQRDILFHPARLAMTGLFIGITSSVYMYMT